MFDASGRLLMFPTMFGVKVVDVASGRVVRVVGSGDSTATRFMQLALCQECAAADHAASTSGMEVVPEQAAAPKDPTLFCTAWKQARLFLLTSHEPADGSQRDAQNERAAAGTASRAARALAAEAAARRARTATIHTTLGDICVQLFPDECPRTVENFTVHSRNGYYNGVLFHRVVKGFMVQTGDPKGDGTGGESIWGGDFEDEFCRALRHDRPFTVSMANAGPNTNGSQFFITTAPVPRLDGKHTVFGRVFKGQDIVTAIEDTKTRKKDDRPVVDIRILSIDTSSDPPTTTPAAPVASAAGS